MSVLQRVTIENENPTSLSERVRRQMDDTVGETFADSDSLQQAEVRDLLLTAEELLTVRDPANKRLNRIKAALRQKIDPRYQNNQLSFFNDLDGYAFLDPKDSEKIVVHHPDVALGYQIKHQRVVSWKDVRRSIALERQRLHNITNQTVAPETSGRIAALVWIEEQIEAYTSYRTRDDFVSVGEQDQEQED